MRMQKRPWIFSALTFLLLANLILGRQKVLGGILFVFWMLRIQLLNDRRILGQIALVSLFFVSITCLHQQKNKTTLTGDERIFLLATELSSIKVDGDYLSFRGTIQKADKKDRKEKVAVRYYLKTEVEKQQWLNSKGSSHVRIYGELDQPAQNSNYNQFNYQDYLKRNKIHWQLYAEEIDSLDSINLKQSLFYQIDSMRYQIIQYMDRVFHEKVSSYLKILFIADGSALTEAIKESYRALGLIHLFSISGFHITYLANTFQRFFLRMGITHERTNILLVIILPFYGLLAGLSISIFRAVCQRTLLLWSTILDKELSNIDAWGLAMIASLAINPYHLFEIAFHLSYSLSGLFILMGQLEWIKGLTLLKQSLIFSFLSFLVSIPLLSYHFYEISWITIGTNLLFLPFFTYFLFPSLTILFFISFLAADTQLFLFLNKIYAFILLNVEKLLLNITEQFDFSFVIGRLPKLIMIILGVCILHYLKKIEQKKLPSITISLLFILSMSWNRISPVGYVLMLDVGQGDSILIKEPGTRKITLIDTGGEVQWQEKEKWQERGKSFTIGKDIVASSLKSQGITAIDRLYITHAHEDHMGELENIYKELLIKEVAATQCTFKNKELIRNIIPLKESKVFEIKPMEQLDYPTKHTLALQPLKDYKSKNDQSLVLYVKMGDDDWLFTGDMEEAAENDLIQEYPNLSVDYLKVAHHGSKTSSSEAFINHIQPEIALISVSQKNRYGHPSTEVLQLLEDKKITTYSTAEHGAIKVSYFKVPLSNKWLTKNETIK